MQLATFTPLFGSPRGEAGPWWRVQSPCAKVLACTPLSAFWFEGICWLAWRFDQRVPSTGAIVGCECALCQVLDLDVKQDVFPRLFDPGSWGLQVLINLVIVGVCLSLSSSKVNDHHRRQTQQPSGRTATQSRCFCYWAEWYQGPWSRFCVLNCKLLAVSRFGVEISLSCFRCIWKQKHRNNNTNQVFFEDQSLWDVFGFGIKSFRASSNAKEVRLYLNRARKRIVYAAAARAWACGCWLQWSAQYCAQSSRSLFLCQ